VQSKSTVLVVDDDETILKVVRASLAKHGYEIEVAEDGVAALMMLGARRFDLIISDIEMPNLDGFRLLELISAKQIKTPVIFLTGHEGDEREVRGLELGAVDFIRKPISPQVLLARVRRVVPDRS
jgi:DNA-binding response OmpR family regulator